MHSNTKRVALLGLLTAFALVLSYIEAMIPFFFGVPGMKLGLANLAVLLALYLYGWREALTVNVLRVLLSGFLFGNLQAILFSLAGAFTSFIVMCALKKTGRFSAAGVSVGGGVAHNTGQLLIAMFVVETAGVAYFLPLLLIAGAVTGFVIGAVATRTLPYMERVVRQG